LTAQGKGMCCCDAVAPSLAPTNKALGEYC
jgi:hypothetical protein